VVSTRHVLALEGFGSARFQLELGGYLELVEVLYVSKLSVKLLSLSSFEIDGCGIVFYQGNAYLYREGVSSDTSVLLGVRLEKLYRVLGQPVDPVGGWSLSIIIVRLQREDLGWIGLLIRVQCR
jgi:hypothetical protein